MKSDYVKFVQWSEPDRLFVGYCSDLFIGGVCHGADEQKVYRELSRLVSAEITESQRVKRPLPPESRIGHTAGGGLNHSSNPMSEIPESTPLLFSKPEAIAT